MDYQALAKELMEMRTEMHQMSFNREMSKMVQGEEFVLNYFATHGYKAYPKDISKRMSVSTARIASLLNRLEEEGIVVRRKDPEDNRQTIVTLTEKGILVTEQYRKKMIDRLAWILEQLGPEDAGEYIRLQKKLTECYKNSAMKMDIKR